MCVIREIQYMILNANNLQNENNHQILSYNSINKRFRGIKYVVAIFLKHCYRLKNGF